MSNGPTIVRHVEAFYWAFIDAFNREDTDLYLRSFCYPNAILSGRQGMSVHGSESDQLRFYQQVMTALRGRGWDRTGVDDLKVWPLSDALALGMADLTRYSKDGSILEQRRYCYTFRRGGDVWKILTIAEVKPSFRGRGTEFLFQM